MLDAVVAGAGPVGSWVAAGLAQAGYEVLLVEEHSRPGFPARCTGLVGEQAFQEFDLPGEVTQRRISSCTVHGPAGSRLRWQAQHPVARVVDRPRLDALLAERAREAGARLLLGHRVKDAAVGPRAVEIELEALPRRLAARVLVLATGARSNLPEKLGLGRLPGYVFGAQVEAEVEGLEEVEVYLGRDLVPGSFAWAVPGQEKRARLGLVAYSFPREHLQRFLDDPRLRPRLKGAPAAEATVAPIPLGALARTVGHRVLAVGEAAGQVKTTTGGGVYYGLVGARTAVEVLVRALREDRLDEQSLAEYEIRWRRVLGRELEYGLRLRKLARNLDDRTLARFLHLAQQDGVRLILRSLGRFDWHASLIAALLNGPLARTERRR
ncbi:MAG: NAD(P)/FAD-dependent oxidoreductase [Clostridia bacterium]|nr:NAD(P)/FAD-dependent oxidoreductase [Clostridia bacterium]